MLGISVDAIDLHRMYHGRMPKELRTDYMGIPSAIARRWPDRGPAWPANIVKSLDKLMGTDKPGAVLRILFFVAFLTLPTISTSLLRLFVCTDFDGSSRLDADLSIDCDSTAHRAMMIFAGCFLATVPAVFAFFMIKALHPYRDRINPPGILERAALAMRANDAQLEDLRPFFTDWRPHLWWVVTIVTCSTLTQPRSAQVL